MKIFLNGNEMMFVEGGYEYVFMKPYIKHQHQTIKKENGELTLQLYDNGVQINTLATKEEVSTIINRDIAIDKKNKKVYILEEGNRVVEQEDGSITVYSE